jgi:hypothetical protein
VGRVAMEHHAQVVRSRRVVVRTSPPEAAQPFAGRHGERLGYWVAQAPRSAALSCAATYVTAGTGTCPGTTPAHEPVPTARLLRSPAAAKAVTDP